jgi:hypothetical protein
VDQWSGEYLGCHVGRVVLGNLEPHAMRLLAVHPDLGRPQSIGSTGHLLGDAMDLATESWDDSRGVLTLTPRADGPPGREGELIVFEPGGKIHRIPFAPGAPPMELTFP